MTVSIQTSRQITEAAKQSIDEGLGEFNRSAAPLEQVSTLYSVAHIGELTLGGILGRTWGKCAEIQILWVHPDYRHQGLGSRLMQDFESTAIREFNISTFYLETFTFQAPEFYQRLGYEVGFKISGFTPDIEKFLLIKQL